MGTGYLYPLGAGRIYRTGQQGRNLRAGVQLAADGVP